jgi:hypothetical protein
MGHSEARLGKVPGRQTHKVETRALRGGDIGVTTGTAIPARWGTKAQLTRLWTLALIIVLFAAALVATPVASAQATGGEDPIVAPTTPPRVRTGIIGNVVQGTDGSRTAFIAEAGNDFSGIASINQDAGDLNNQGNAVALAIASEGGGFAFATVSSVPNEITGNRVTDIGAAQSNTIDRAFNGSSGLVQINQTTGMLNAQTNIAAIAFGAGAGAITLTDEALLLAAPMPQGNELTMSEEVDPRTNTFTNSFSDFNGVGQVNQTTGNLNRVTNLVTFTGANF